MCIRIYIFNFKKQQTNKQKKQKSKKAKERRKKNISGKSIKKTKSFSAARVEIFLVTRISGSKSFFWLMKSKFLPRTLIKIIKNSYKNYKVAIR